MKILLYRNYIVVLLFVIVVFSTALADEVERVHLLEVVAGGAYSGETRLDAYPGSALSIFSRPTPVALNPRAFAQDVGADVHIDIPGMIRSRNLTVHSVDYTATAHGSKILTGYSDEIRRYRSASVVSFNITMHEDQEITARFDKMSYSLDTLATAGGSIDPTESSVLHGESKVFTVTPDVGYAIDAVTGCSGSLSGNTYTTGAITGACTISASFTQNQYLDRLELRAFVEQQYRDFLGREGEAQGVGHWTRELERGRVTHAEIADLFFSSREFQDNIAPVARLYFAYFGRIPDYPGLMYWVEARLSGGELERMSQAFADSSEFVATYGALGNEAFVDRVYTNVLGRLPDSAGRTHWVNALRNGMSRGAMMVAFSESEEYWNRSYHQVQVTMMYVSMLRRSPEQSGFEYWVSAKAAGGSVSP